VGAGVFKPLPPKSTLFETHTVYLNSLMTPKGFRDKFGSRLCRSFSWCKINCLDIVVSLLSVPKVNKLFVLIFMKKKGDSSLMGNKKKSTEEKCKLLSWGRME